MSIKDLCHGLAELEKKRPAYVTRVGAVRRHGGEFFAKDHRINDELSSTPSTSGSTSPARWSRPG
jgi:hypothetical protein